MMRRKKESAEGLKLKREVNMKKTELKPTKTFYKKRLRKNTSQKLASIALIALVNNAHSLIRNESAEEGRFINTQKI